MISSAFPARPADTRVGHSHEPSGWLQGFAAPSISPRMERVLLFAFALFMIVQAVEAPLRYALSLAGAPWLIYVRDLAVLAALLGLATEQMRRRQLQTTFIVFALLIFFHGTVSFLMCYAKVAVLVSMKTLLSPLFGAIVLPILFKRSRFVGGLFALLWLVTSVGIVLDYAGYDLPWKGMSSDLGDYKVTINRKWNYQGQDRIGGFSRDSVSAAMLLSYLGLYALLFARSISIRLVAACAGLGLIYMTTSKGAVVGYALAVVACVLPTRRTQLLNKCILTLTFALMMLLPIILPNYLMPSSTTFLASFFDRVARVWPDTWHNIGQHSWVFGSAMGNVGIGQQYLNFEDVNTGDNLFVLAYGYFGIFSTIYLTWLFLAALLRRAPVDVLGRYAIITLIFVFGYGIVVNIIEGPIAAFMLGTAIQALAWRRRAVSGEAAPAPLEPAARTPLRVVS